MSVNGQDPRSNVYLLDGTLQNDFTNGLAGSAGTALGTETVREFRVESNAYSAEFGRNSGGQINVLTKSGANNVDGSLYEFHRNEALDARNYFDAGEQPDFHRNQFGGTVGGPIARDRAFFFIGYEALVERLGKTVSTVVPDDNARTGLLPSGQVPVSPQVAPYLAEYPVANGRRSDRASPATRSSFNQRVDEHFAQGRSTTASAAARSSSPATRSTIPTSSCRPTIRSSRATSSRGTSSSPASTAASCRRIRSASAASASAGPESARTSRPHVAAAADLRGHRATAWATSTSAACGASARRAPAISAWCRTCSARRRSVQTRGRHVLKAGALAEHYQDNMVNPTFSLGIFTFADLSAFQARAASFVGLTPEAQFDRYWRFTLFGFYLQDDSISPRVTLNAGLRYEFSTLPREKYNRDSALPDLTASTPVVGPLYENPPTPTCRRVWAWRGMSSATAEPPFAAATGSTSTPTTIRT